MADGMLDNAMALKALFPASSTKASQFGGAGASVKAISLVHSHSVKSLFAKRYTKHPSDKNVWYLQTLYATLLGQFFPKPRGGEITRNKLYISL